MSYFVKKVAEMDSGIYSVKSPHRFFNPASPGPQPIRCRESLFTMRRRTKYGDNISNCLHLKLQEMYQLGLSPRFPSPVLPGQGEAATWKQKLWREFFHHQKTNSIRKYLSNCMVLLRKNGNFQKMPVFLSIGQALQQCLLLHGV